MIPTAVKALFGLADRLRAVRDGKSVEPPSEELLKSLGPMREVAKISSPAEAKAWLDVVAKACEMLGYTLPTEAT